MPLLLGFLKYSFLMQQYIVNTEAVLAFKLTSYTQGTNKEEDQVLFFGKSLQCSSVSLDVVKCKDLSKSS